MNTNTKLICFALIALPNLANAADGDGQSSLIKHKVVVSLQLPAKTGVEIVKFPVTFTAKGQGVDYSHREQSITVSLAVSDLGPNEITFAYSVSSRSADDPLAPYSLQSRMEFDIAEGKDTQTITVDGKEALSITIEKK